MLWFRRWSHFLIHFPNILILDINLRALITKPRTDFAYKRIARWIMFVVSVGEKLRWVIRAGWRRWNLTGNKSRNSFTVILIIVATSTVSSPGSGNREGDILSSVHSIWIHCESTNQAKIVKQCNKAINGEIKPVI